MKLIDANNLSFILRGTAGLLRKMGNRERALAYEDLIVELNDMGSAWISVKDELPESQVQVLAVKELKSGTRQFGLAYCIRDYEHYNVITGQMEKKPYWVCGGNNNIIYWMPLPEMPDEGNEE